MTILKDASIKRKLTLINMLIIGIILFLSNVILIMNEFISFRRSAINNLRTQAKIIAGNSTAALLFNDSKSAKETLAIMSSATNIVQIIIFTKDGRVFAKYEKDPAGREHYPAVIMDEHYDFGIDQLAFFQPIVFDDEKIGTIYIKSNLKELYSKVLRNGRVIVVILSISFFIALFLLLRLQRTITLPLSELSDLMRSISKEKDYSRRAAVNRNDEIGSLAEVFNDMLQQIQKRDEDLDHHRKNLEKTVFERTAALENSNRKLEQELAERKRAEEKITHMAYYDSLTNLPNRILFQDRLEIAISTAKRHKRLMSVLFLDLDNFKRINDTFGHRIGDNLLQNVTERLSSCLRSGDSVCRSDGADMTIARQGGDEFTILLAEIRHPHDPAKVSKRLLDALSKPFLLEGQSVFITASLGIVIYPNDGEDVESLLKNADRAMYHAKEHGRNNFQFYEASMNSKAIQRFIMEYNLHKALENDEFLLHYQPQADMLTGEIIGIEALIRWRHPEIGMVSPIEFIPLAEETGLIIPISDWVLRTACMQSRKWQHTGLISIPVSVNMSGHQFNNRDLTENISKVLSDAGLDPQYLILEITESILMQKTDTTVAILNELTDMGFRLSIDDFGTGYSSLSYLQRFPLHSIKIPRDFVRGVNTNPKDATIVKAIIAMAHGMGARVVAEGVETEEQMRFLQKHACDEIQGYLISRPLPSGEIMKFLADSTFSLKSC